MGQTVKSRNEEIREFLIDKGFNPDVILHFLEEQLEANRKTDLLIKDVIGKQEFYSREIIYSQIEILALSLKK